MDDTFEVGGMTYCWNERVGLTKNNMKVPTAETPYLLARLEPSLSKQDEAVTNPLALAARAATARKIGHRRRAGDGATRSCPRPRLRARGGRSLGGAAGD
jgi:hypothetical protein